MSPASNRSADGRHAGTSSGVSVVVTDTEPATETLDDAALLRLYPRLRRFAAVVAPIEVAPDDLVQEALTRLFARGTDDVMHVEAYLRQVMVRLSSNHRRRLGRGRRAFDRLVRSDGFAGASRVADAYQSDVSFLDGLGADARAVLYLHDEVEGLDFRGVARQLDLTEGGARQLAARARHQLRHHLQEDR